MVGNNREADPIIVTGRQTAEGNAGEGDRLRGHEVITLFVENLPENLHWKGLWFLFARHGEVANVYIARKRSRGGKRFGFIRTKGLELAERVMNRLHGFILYGSKLTVKRARNNFELDRKRFSGSLPHKPRTMGNSVGTSLGHGEGLEASRLRRANVKEIGFNDGTTYPLSNIGKKILEVSEKSNESTSVSIPSAEKRLEVESVDRSRPRTEAEVLQSLWAERNCINDDSREKEAFRGKVNFLELMGGECNDLLGVNDVERGAGEIRVWNGGTEGNEVAEEANINPTHDQLGGELGHELTKVQGPDFELISNVLHHSGPQGIRVEVDPTACSIGLLGIEDYLGGADIIPYHNQKLSWVDIMSGKENSGLLVSKDLVDGKITEHGSDRGFIVDSDEDKANRRKRKAKKYGSILDIQNQINLFAVKVALETYLRAGWAKKAALSIELDNKVMVNWILNPSQRPWGVARSMVEIDKLVCECVTVHFRSVALQDLTMAVTLAQDGIDKRDW
ncbi:hypothetical protein V6N12_060863 [Hibiscus sabdariffa]|uniref:RRM domain-containing protein n=1 Tax=Hibiscus sabdariffa TaxID=183260 RepID=A0ABR2D8H9_9ROSI